MTGTFYKPKLAISILLSFFIHIFTILNIDPVIIQTVNEYLDDPTVEPMFEVE